VGAMQPPSMKLIPTDGGRIEAENAAWVAIQMHTEATPTHEARPPNARVLQLLAFLPKALLAGLLIFAILDMLAGVLLRYVVVAITDYFDLPGVNFFWVEEIGEFTLAWLTLVGGGIALLERTHFELAILVHRLPAHMQWLIERTNYWLIAGFGLLAAIYGWKLAALNSVLLSPALEINLAWLYLSASAGGALIAIYGAAIALGLIERKPATIEPP
jgi:TRAP-type C4-dicarboxylate transport system permease small subunit